MMVKKNVRQIVYAILFNISPKVLASYLYKKTFGRNLNWKNPKDINEKINWLSFNSDTSKWSSLADKYLVRDYVKKCGLEDLLVPLYGFYERCEDINWETLPQEFVMKVNNGCGDVMVCTDKCKLNVRKTVENFNKLLSKKFGVQSAEPHYLKIKPCVIVEKLLDLTTQPVGGGKSLIDYKIWCFNGLPECIP